MQFFGTFWALVPPIIAIALALITKEVYSSLFIGVVVGGLLAAGFNVPATLDNIINEGFITSVSDIAGILVFLVLLGIVVALVNKSGAAESFGKFTAKHIKSKVGAAICTFIFGVLIFIDDYFNCLTVGAVMTPVCDEKKMSRAKLAYLIDATAAPVCMIAPISSWAAAVSGCVESETMSGLELFVRAIPFNFYSLLTFVFIIVISILGFDYGKMRLSEMKAANGDLGALPAEASSDGEEEITEEDDNIEGPGAFAARFKMWAKRRWAESNAHVFDMIIPIIILIVACVVALIYNGGFFDAGSEFFHDFIGAFGNTDAVAALPWGGIIALVFSIIYLWARGLIRMKTCMDSIPVGFKMMVPAILILILATSLKNMTGLLGSSEFVQSVMAGASATLYKFLPAFIFIAACLIAFATGTSWGTFGILIPIVTSIFAEGDPLMFVGVSACLAGAVCGDHCSPISDTTIMASAGAQCNHVEHVSTQLPYAITVAIFSFVGFIISGFIPNALIVLPIMIVLMVIFLLVMKKLTANKEARGGYKI